MESNSWFRVVACNNCGTTLELPTFATEVKHLLEENHVCDTCKKVFKLYPNGVSYAYAESMGPNYYRFRDDNVIEVRYFLNPPMDKLEEVWQDWGSVFPNELKPTKLLPIVKKYHDAIKDRIRRSLEVQPGELNPEDVERIKNDPPPNLNLIELFDYLKKAHPKESNSIQVFFSEREEIIKQILWLRNKQEHLLYSQWPIPSKIFTDRKQNPFDDLEAKELLNTNFIGKVHDLTIDFFIFIQGLYTGERDIKNYSWIDPEYFRKKPTSWIDFGLDP